MRTPATDLVGIDVPIFGFSHCRDVVAAVTNAGGCGVLGAVAHSPEQLDVDLAWIEAEVKGKPYGVDLLVPEKFAGSDEGGLDRGALADLMPAEHKYFVDDLLARYDVPRRPSPRVPAAGWAACASTRRAWPRCSTCCSTTRPASSLRPSARPRPTSSSGPTPPTSP